MALTPPPEPAIGLLAFPVTHFDDQLAGDEPRYRDHLAWQAELGMTGLFAGDNAGEGFFLAAEEIDTTVRVAVEEAGAQVPVIAPATART